MPRHRFTLAALATVAVPGLHVTSTQAFTGGGDGRHHSALVTDAAGRHLVVRMPAGATDRHRLDEEVRALGALTTGVRARLPFAVPEVIGTGDGVVVTTHVPGTRLAAGSMKPDGALPAGVARAIAAVHDLPSSVVATAGLPVRDAAEVARVAADLIARADGSGDVPHELVDRWSAAAADPRLWRFRPVVVHGGLAAGQVLVGADGVTGVLGWSGLSVGDPATDLAWSLGLPRPGAASAVLAAYRSARPNDPDPALPQRALLHAELEVARWLLFGREAGDATVVRDARGMLEALLDGVLHGTAESLKPASAPATSVAEAERLLDGRHGTAGTPLATQAARSSAAE